MAELNNNLRIEWSGRLGILLSAIMVALWASGCGGGGPGEASLKGGTETLLPRLTTVVTGPIAILLTNAEFQGEFTLTFDNASAYPSNLTGQIFSHGGKLRFEAVSGKSKYQDEFGVVWDVAANSGYAFSEALQGYAPVGEAVHFINTAEPATGELKRIGDRLFRASNATVVGSDGQTNIIELLRARETGNLPIQLRLRDQPHAFTLTLSKIQPIPAANELFLSPDGFKKYETETALISELSARKQSVLGGGHKYTGEAKDADWQDTRRRSNSEAP